MWLTCLLMMESDGFGGSNQFVTIIVLQVLFEICSLLIMLQLVCGCLACDGMAAIGDVVLEFDKEMVMVEKEWRVWWKSTSKRMGLTLMSTQVGRTTKNETKC